MVALVSVAVTSCKQDKPSRGVSYDVAPEKPILGDTVQAKDDRSVDEFHSAFVYDADTVSIVIGGKDKYGVDITGPHTYVKCHKSQVRDKNLYVKYENKDTHYRKTHVAITSSQLNCIRIHGCNVLIIDGKDVGAQHLLVELTDVDKIDNRATFSGESVALHIDNAGGTYEVKCKDLKLRLGNSAKIALKGTAHNVIFQSGERSNADISKLRTDSIITRQK